MKAPHFLSMSRLLRPLAIAVSILTIAGEVACLFLVYFYQRIYTWSDLLFPLAGIIVALATLLVWLFYIPQTKKLSGHEQGELLPSEEGPSPPPDLAPPIQPSWSTDETPTLPSYPTSLRFISHCCAYTVPKEGEQPFLSQDKYQCFADHERCRIAVADGVGGSFLPSKWAEIVVNSFVLLLEDFNTPEKFHAWLTPCRQQWRDWVDNEWIPRMRYQHKSFDDWHNERTRGAETTLIGCSFSQLALSETGHTNILVIAVGDAVFFQVRPPISPDGQWQHTAFALDNPDDFGVTPQTLLSVAEDEHKAWKQVKRQIYAAYRGDYVLLTTDALAKWILLEIKQARNPWEKLLSLVNYDAFCTFVRQEREKRTIELDDTTMMVMPII